MFLRFFRGRQGRPYSENKCAARIRMPFQACCAECIQSNPLVKSGRFWFVRWRIFKDGTGGQGGRGKGTRSFSPYFWAEGLAFCDTFDPGVQFRGGLCTKSNGGVCRHGTVRSIMFSWSVFVKRRHPRASLWHVACAGDKTHTRCVLECE